MPVTKAWYKPDHKSFGEFILSEKMRDVTTEVARDIAGVAAVDTPVGDGKDGHMKDKYDVVREGGTMKVHRAFRVMVKVTNSDPAAPLVEFGGKHNKRRRVLARAGAKFGDFKPEGGQV